MLDHNTSRPRSSRAAAEECSKFLHDTAKDILSNNKNGSSNWAKVKLENTDSEGEAPISGAGSSSVAGGRGRSTAGAAGAPGKPASKTPKSPKPARAQKRRREADAVQDDEEDLLEIADIMVRKLKHKPFRRIPLDMTMTGIWFLPVSSQQTC